MNEAHSARIGLHVWSVLQTTTTGGTDEKSWGFYTRCSTVSKPSDRRVAQGDLEVGRVPALPRRDRSDAPAPPRRPTSSPGLPEPRFSGDRIVRIELAQKFSTSCQNSSDSVKICEDLSGLQYLMTFSMYSREIS